MLRRAPLDKRFLYVSVTAINPVSKAQRRPPRFKRQFVVA